MKHRRGLNLLNYTQYPRSVTLTYLRGETHGTRQHRDFIISFAKSKNRIRPIPLATGTG